MKISILGTNGFLSNSITKYFYQQKWTTNVYGLFEPINDCYDKFYKVDLMQNEFDVTSLIDSDIIVYAIGAGIQSNLNEGNEMIYRLNVTVPIQICNHLRESQYQGAFITFGSVFEVGETIKTTPFSEEDVITSLNHAPTDYVVSKRMLTRYISSYNTCFKHWHFIIPTIYGPGENPKRLIPYTIESIKNNKELHFTAGDQVRQYIYVDEVPVIIQKSYQCKIPTGIYNLHTEDIISVKELVTLIHDVLGKKVSNSCFGTAQRTDVGMKYLALNGEKLYKLIQYTPQTILEDIIKQY